MNKNLVIRKIVEEMMNRAEEYNHEFETASELFEELFYDKEELKEEVFGIIAEMKNANDVTTQMLILEEDNGIYDDNDEYIPYKDIIKEVRKELNKQLKERA